MPSTQTPSKILFGEAFADLRERAGVSVQQVADLWRKNTSQVYKIENGHYLCAYSELERMLDLCEASLEDRANLQTLYDEARLDNVRVQGSSAMPPKFRTFLRLEASARSIRTLHSNAIPGLCQTEAYFRAILHAARRFDSPPIDADKANVARISRQRLIQGRNPRRLHAIVDEGVIRRNVGGREVMAEQLEHLIALGQQDNVTIQVIDEDAGAYGGMSGAVTVLSFDGARQSDSVYCEYQGGGEWVNRREDVSKYLAMFDDVSVQALSASRSAALIRARIKEIEGP